MSTVVLSMDPISLVALHWYDVAWMAEEYFSEANGRNRKVLLSGDTSRTSPYAVEEDTTRSGKLRLCQVIKI
jgi:hypothetical protein